MSLRSMVVSIAVAGLVWGASAVAAEPESVSLKRYSKTGEVTELATGKASQQPKEKQNLIGLLKLGQSKSPLLCYETLDGGVVGFLGQTQIVFAEGNSLDEVKKVAAEKWKAAFDEFKPIPMDKAKELREADPKKPRSRNGVMIMVPTVLVAPLVGRPSDFVVCKADGKLYLIQIVEHKAKGDTVQLKIHPLQ